MADPQLLDLILRFTRGDAAAAEGLSKATEDRLFLMKALPFLEHDTPDVRRTAAMSITSKMLDSWNDEPFKVTFEERIKSLKQKVCPEVKVQLETMEDVIRNYEAQQRVERAAARASPSPRTSPIPARGPVAGRPPAARVATPAVPGPHPPSFMAATIPNAGRLAPQFGTPLQAGVAGPLTAASQSAAKSTAAAPPTARTQPEARVQGVHAAQPFPPFPPSIFELPVLREYPVNPFATASSRVTDVRQTVNAPPRHPAPVSFARPAATPSFATGFHFAAVPDPDAWPPTPSHTTVPTGENLPTGNNASGERVMEGNSVSEGGGDTHAKKEARAARDVRLECSICWEPYTRPVALNCGHVFCADCVSQVVKSKARSLCAVCRKAITKRMPIYF